MTTAKAVARVQPSGHKQSENLTHPGLILRLLRRIQRTHVQLSLTLPGSGKPYNTAILDINSDAHTMTLDQVMPAEGNALLKNADELYAHTRMDGIEIDFSGRPIRIETHAEGMRYRIPIPRIVYYRQRRTAYRAPIKPAGMIVPICLSGTGMTDIPVNGELHDISIGGIGAEVEARMDRPLTRRTVYPRCEIELPIEGALYGAGGNKIVCRLELTFTQAGAGLNRGRVRIGGRFLSLTASQEKRIAHFVRTIERDLIRSKHDESPI